MASHRVAIAAVLAISTAVPAAGQRTGGSAPAAILTGTLQDPLGQAAENTTITLVGVDADVAVDTHTDDTGRFAFVPVAPGAYLLKAPTSDAISPSTVMLGPGERLTLDARLTLEEVSVVIRVCRDCKPDDYKLNEIIKRESGPQRDADTAIVQPAEPDEGWIAFNERPVPYPPAIKATRLQGTVMIDGTVAPDGSSAGLTVVSSPNTQLTELALPLVQAQRWKAARVRATAVEVPLHVSVEFSLYGD